MEKLFSFDVTLKDLESLRGSNETSNYVFSALEKDDELLPESNRTLILDFLKMYWQDGSGGGNLEYWDRVRVGTVDVYLDDNYQLHLDFVTRFHFENSPQIIEALKQLKD